MASTDRYTVQRSSYRSLPPARLQPDRGYLKRGVQTVVQSRHPVVEGELAVRWERRGVAVIMWISGSLDQATVTLLDRELDGRPVGSMHLVIDLTGLEFIDSTGLDALVGIHWRISERGDELSFRRGSRVARRPLELTRTLRRPGSTGERRTLPSRASLAPPHRSPR